MLWWGAFLNLTGVDGIISSEDSDADGKRVSSDDCLKINIIKLEDFVLYNFNKINWTCIMIGWI